MNDQPKGRTIPKQKLQIVNVEMDVPYSQGTKQLDRVHAVNVSLPEGDPLAGKTLRHTVFNGDLKTFIRGKTTITADVEERPRPESEYGPDRTIVQAYDDQGNPVSRKQGGGGGGYQRRSLEDDLALEAFKRVSIEGQSMANQVGALVLAVANGAKLEGVGLDVETFKRLEAKYWQAVEKGLDNYLKEPLAEILKKFPAVGSPPKAPGNAQDGQGTAERPAAVKKDAPPPGDPLKNVGDLLTRASKLKPPVKPEELYAALKVNGPTEIKDLPAAWLTACSVSEKKKTAKPLAPAPEKLFE